MTDTLYDEDFVTWTERQAAALRQAAREGSNLPIDFDNLAEEVEDLGKRDRREVESYVGLILEHLVKLTYSPAISPRTIWQRELRNYRWRLERMLRDSPSLRGRLSPIIDAELLPAITSARDALQEHNESLPPSSEVAARLRSFPEEQIMGDWLPHSDGGEP